MNQTEKERFLTLVKKEYDRNEEFSEVSGESEVVDELELFFRENNFDVSHEELIEKSQTELTNDDGDMPNRFTIVHLPKWNLEIKVEEECEGYYWRYYFHEIKEWQKEESLAAKIDFEGGKVVYDELTLHPDIPLDEQKERLKEDLLQVEFQEKSVLLDVGYYGKHSKKKTGFFRVAVISNSHWEKPAFVKEAYDIEDVLDKLKEAVGYIGYLSKAK